MNDQATALRKLAAPPKSVAAIAPETDAPITPVPAPWIVDEVNTINGVTYYVNHLWQDEQGETHVDEIAEVVMDYRGTRARANADLLSAGHELRAACQRFLDAHAAGMPVPSFGGDPRDCHCGPCDEARAAIAKSMGQQVETA